MNSYKKQPNPIVNWFPTAPQSWATSKQKILWTKKNTCNHWIPCKIGQGGPQHMPNQRITTPAPRTKTFFLPLPQFSKKNLPPKKYKKIFERSHMGMV